MTINLSTLAAGAVLTVAVSLATPSLAGSDFSIDRKTVYHNDGTVTKTVKVKDSAGSAKIKETTDSSGKVLSHKAHTHSK